MQLFFNQLSQIDYKPEDLSSSLNDLLQAIDVFIEAHPLACNQCQTGCCRKPWSVEVDNVSVNRQSDAVGCSKSAYIDQYLVLDENRYFDFDQFVMKKQTPHCPWVSPDNRCQIYSNRPLICRLYMCSPKSVRYNQLREAAAATFLQALVFEHIIVSQETTPDQRRYFARNPALNATDYSMKLQTIIDYAYDEGWL